MPAELLTLENAAASFVIDRSTGCLKGLRWKSKGIDLFEQIRGGIPGYTGGIRVYDELERRMYSDLEDESEVRVLAEDSSHASFEKRFAGASFVLKVGYAVSEFGLEWTVDAAKADPSAADRSLRVYFLMPLIAGWDIWAPCNHGEKTFDGMTPFEFMYTQIPYVSEQEIILPMVSHYNRRLGVGFSMVEPIEANVPAAKFGFNNMEKCFNWGSMRKKAQDVPMLEAVNYCIGLVGDRPMTTSVHLAAHGGDWRPGLGMVYDRWREFFDPFNESIFDREGVFIGGGPGGSKQLDKYHATGGKFMEYHCHFENYCDYFQEGRDKWIGILKVEHLRRVLLDEKRAKIASGEIPPDPDMEYKIAWEVEELLATHSDAEIAEKLGLADVNELHLTRDGLKEDVRKLADGGISVHWYFNYTDGFRPRVERDWPDSICRDEEGAPIPSGWYMCHNMNADPRWSFGKFAFESARKIFAEYPELDGFFLDCFRHYEIDFAHDDGVTVVNGKPCYSVNRSYDDIERKIKTEIMKPLDKTSFANKPMSIRSMRYVDAQMIEGDGDMYEEKFFWASIANPLIFLWTSGKRPLDEYLRRSVLHGAWPRTSNLDDETAALYRGYLPLYEQFRRRVFCFEPDPLRVPDGSRGKLYTVPGGYVAGIANLNVLDADEVRWSRRPYALFRVKRGWDVKKALVSFPGDESPREIAFKFDGTFIAVPLDGYRNCAVVKLCVEGDSGKEIGPDIFDVRGPMCCDPDSAFEDITVR